MASPANRNLSAIKIDWPNELLDLIRADAAHEDETVSAFIRGVVARHVGWEGPTRNIQNYSPAERG